MTSLEEVFEKTEEDLYEGLPERIRNLDAIELQAEIQRKRNELGVMRSEFQTITVNQKKQTERIKENKEKVKMNKQLPFLVGHIVEKLDPDDLAAANAAGKWNPRTRPPPTAEDLFRKSRRDARYAIVMAVS